MSHALKQRNDFRESEQYLPSLELDEAMVAYEVESITQTIFFLPVESTQDTKGWEF